MNKINLKLGSVQDKSITTLNDFVSHMIEHLAWRMGVSIDLSWDNTNWQKLGVLLGEKILEISKFSKKEIATIGMIDDGMSKIKMMMSAYPVLIIKATNNVDLNFFINNRCEQLENGECLIELLQGLAEGVGVDIEVLICNHRDSHHTWEGVFRGVGVCLAKLFNTFSKTSDLDILNNVEVDCVDGDVKILERSLFKSTVLRGTAESNVKISIDLDGDFKQSVFIFDVGSSIQKAVQNLDKLFMILAESFDVQLEIKFMSKLLNSSHVVLEDVGLVMGRALLEILKLRFEKLGATGSGSSIQNIIDFKTQNGVVGVSVEGRKLWQFIPSDGDFNKLDKNFLQFQDVFKGIRSEDLDDFIDGLAGGLLASIMIFITDINDANLLWQAVFCNLGVALKEVFEINSSRKGLPPGVKATLS